MRYRWLAILLLMMLVGCSAFESDDGGDADTGVTSAEPDSVVQWDDSPSNVVFRAEITGGSEDFFRLNEIPLCTIYGDGHVVWTVTGSNNITDVLHDRISPQTIENFVLDLTFGDRIYEYGTEADLVSGDGEQPVIEQLTLHVNDLVHVTDAFGGWDYAYFEQIYNACASLSETPVIYEPEGAWVSAQAVDYNPDAPSIGWNEDAQGIDLEALATSGERVWVTGATVRALWELLQTSAPNAQFEQGAGAYNIALQIPNVTIDAPQPPEDES